MFTTVTILLILAVLAGLLLYNHLTRNFNYWKRRKVPYAKPIPIFGSIFKVLAQKTNLADFLGDLYKSTTSPILGFFAFDQPFLLIRNLELIKACLIKDSDHFLDRTVIENFQDDPIGSSMLFIVKNPTWKPVRAKITPVFATGKLKNMLPLITDASDDLVDYLSRIAIKEQSNDTREIAMKFTTDVVASCAFGINANCFKQENAEFRQISRRIFDSKFSRRFQMMCYFFASFLVKPFRMTFLDSTAAKFLKNVFRQTLLARKKSDVQRGDLIDILIQIEKQNNANDYTLDGDMLVAQVATFVAAGVETTGATISFALYELSLNSAVQDRLRSEIQRVLQKHGKITHEAIQEINYLNMVVNETLRKYPALAYLDRRCTKSYKIPGTDVVIEKGMPVYIPLFGLHRDPQYFPDPEKFDPERFDAEQINTRPKFCYLPFGEGPHNCIGSRFGLLATKVALIRIINEFKVERGQECPVSLELDPMAIILCPKSQVSLRFKRA